MRSVFYGCGDACGLSGPGRGGLSSKGCTREWTVRVCLLVRAFVGEAGVPASYSGWRGVLFLLPLM